MRCAVRSRSWWRRSWTSTECWSPGLCPGSSEGPVHPLEPGILPTSAPALPAPGPDEGLRGFCHPQRGPLVPPSSLALPPLVPSCPQEGQLVGRQGEEADAAPAGGGPPWGPTPGGRWGWQHREPGGPPRDGALRGQGGRWDRWVWGPGDQDGPYPMSPILTLVLANALGLSLHLVYGAGLPCGKPLSSCLPPACAATHPVLRATAAFRTSEQQGTLARGHLSQAQGGDMPCPRSHSGLVSEPAQASLLSPPSFTQTSPLPLAASFPCLFAASARSPFRSAQPLPAQLHILPPYTFAGSLSPAPMRRAQSSLCLRDETLAGGRRRKLSSRFPVGRSSESFSPGDTPRQRFRQRRPGPLGAPTSHGKGERPGSLLPFALRLPWTQQPLGFPSCPLGLRTSPAHLCSGPHGPLAALCSPRTQRGVGWLYRDPVGTQSRC